MEQDPLSPAVRHLIVERLDSVRQLEIVLLLHASAGRSWTADQVAAELGVSEQWTAEQLGVLARRWIVRRAGAAYQYAAEGGLHQAIAELATAYAQYPVTVVTMIYSNPNRAARSFADAFRLRRDQPPPDASGDEGGGRG